VLFRYRCRTCLLTLGLGLSLGTHQAAAQGTSPASPSQQTSSLSEDRDVSIRELPGNIIQDQKQIWNIPFKPKRINHWWPPVIVLGVTGTLVASDPYTAPHFLNTTNFHGYNQVFGSTNSAAMIVAVPAAIYVVGWLRKDSYAENSALLAGEAAADVYLVDMPFKFASARRQPLSYTGSGPYVDNFFDGSHSPFHSGGFYSGHAALSMAVATVIAHRYRRHRWVPFVAYGLAGAISFSRITTSNHFPGDAVFGSAMGFLVAHYVVLPAR
jgi:membrane-associated phospholipid phosphatase